MYTALMKCYIYVSVIFHRIYQEYDDMQNANAYRHCIISTSRSDYLTTSEVLRAHKVFKRDIKYLWWGHTFANALW